MQKVERQKHKDRRRRRLTGVLLCALLLAVCVTAGLLLRKEAEEEPHETYQPVTGAVIQRSAEELRSLTVTQRGEKPWTVVREEDGSLRLQAEEETEPVVWTVDEGIAKTLIDVATAYGYRTVLTAADDTHFYGDEVGRGAVYVKADALSRDAIVSAILNGDVLATTGPFISCSVEDGYFVLRCEAGCRYVQFFTNNYFNPDTTTTGGVVREARFRIKRADRFVRAEAVDFEGRVAYSQYYYLR